MDSTPAFHQISLPAAIELPGEIGELLHQDPPPKEVSVLVIDAAENVSITISATTAIITEAMEPYGFTSLILKSPRAELAEALTSLAETMGMSHQLCVVDAGKIPWTTRAPRL